MNIPKKLSQMFLQIKITSKNIWKKLMEPKLVKPKMSYTLLILAVLIILIIWFLINATENPVSVIGIILILSGIGLMIVLQGLRKIPVAKVALVLFFGERIPKVKKEGWRSFFLCPYVFDYILIDLIRRSPEYTPKDTRTPDNTEVKVTISITWHPNSDDPNALITFINNGQIKGVEDILGGVVGERIRQWARSIKEGPQTWEEAQASGSDAVEVILETILARDVTAGELKDCIRGNGNLRMSSLGIIIDRLNIVGIEVTEEVKKAADRKAKEIQEREAEKIEQEGFRARIKESMDMGMAMDQAVELMQTNTLKVSKVINENKTTLSPETRDLVRDVFGSPAIVKTISSILTVLTNKKGKNRKKGGKNI